MDFVSALLLRWLLLTGLNAMWLGISGVTYIILLILGLLFFKGASAKAIPPVLDLPRPETERTTAEPVIPVAAAYSAILASRCTRVGCTGPRDQQRDAVCDEVSLLDSIVRV